MELMTGFSRIFLSDVRVFVGRGWGQMFYLYECWLAGQILANAEVIIKIF